METNTSFEKKWLVKSEQRILGPFSYEQIEELLKKKQISLLDEIRDMERRWSFIREVPEFKPLVELVRREVDQASELTQTLQTKTNQETHSITRKEASITIEQENLELAMRAQGSQDQPSIPETQSLVIEKNSTQPVKVVDVTFKETFDRQDGANQPPKTPERGRAPRYGSSTDVQVQAEVEQSSKSYLFGFVIIVVGMIAGYFFWQNQRTQNQLKADLDSINLVRRMALVSNSAKVVELYSKLPKPLQKKVLPDLINYFPLLRDFGVTASPEFVESFKQSYQLNSERLAQLEMFQYVNAMNAADFESGQKHLISAVSLNPSSDVVIENEALYNLARGKFADAKSIFEKLINRQDGMVQGRWIYGLLLSTYKDNQLNDNRSALEMIGRHLFTRMDYGREIRLFQLFLSKRDNNRSLFEASLRDYLQSPIQVGSMFRQDPLVWLAGYDQSVQDELVSKIIVRQKGFEFDRLLQYFVASFALEKSRFDQVETFFKSNVSEAKSVEYASLEFQFYFLQNRKPDAFAVLGSQELDKMWVYTQFLVGKGILEAKSFMDSHGSLLPTVESVILRETGFLPNYYTFLKKWNSSDADRQQKLREFLDVNLTLSPDFLPYIAAKSELQ